MKVIVGLGNPGSQYLLTRHNLGFMAIDALTGNAPDSQFKSEHKALTLKARLGSESCFLVKPQTFMNLSGASIGAIMNYYDVDMDNLLVIHDEVDIPFGAMKFQRDRGHGGHNGIRSTHEVLGSRDYARLKLGVGRPSGRMQVANFLLSNFTKAELEDIPEFLDRACDGIETWVNAGVKVAANEHNRPPEKTN
jgi:PTH1 family peptidyl-tRNA hydrolase